MYPVIPLSDVKPIGATSVQFDLTLAANRTYLLTATVACWVCQGANPTAEIGLDGNMVVGAGEPPIRVRGDNGAKLAIRTAATALVLASLDLDTPSVALDTIVEAREGGSPGNGITVTGAVGAAVLVSQVGRAVTLTWVDGVTTVAVLEAAITAYLAANPTSALIKVKTAGTGATVLAAADIFAATALAGGSEAGFASLVPCQE